jgi:hypothetical protein
MQRKEIGRGKSENGRARAQQLPRKLGMKLSPTKKRNAGRASSSWIS